MTFVELLEKGGLPEGASSAMASALDRRMRGKRITRDQADLANRLIGLIEHERACRAHVDWQLRDESLRNQVGARPPARPGGPANLSAPAPSRPSSGRGSGPTAGGGAFPAGRRSSMDARQLSDGEYVELLRAHGYDTSFFESRNSPPPPLPSAPLALRQQALARAAAQRQAAREKVIAGGAIDARNAPARDVAKRYADLGLDPMLAGALRDPGKSLDPPPREKIEPPAARAAAAEKRVRQLEAATKRRGTRLDTRTLSREELAAWMRLRGYSAGGW